MKRKFGNVFVVTAAMCSLFVLSGFGANGAHAAGLGNGLYGKFHSPYHRWKGEWACSFNLHADTFQHTSIAHLIINGNGDTKTLTRAATSSAGASEFECTSEGAISKVVGREHYVTAKNASDCIIEGDVETPVENVENTAECIGSKRNHKGQYTELKCIDLTVEEVGPFVQLTTCTRI